VDFIVEFKSMTVFKKMFYLINHLSAFIQKELVTVFHAILQSWSLLPAIHITFQIVRSF